jgi:hypothetical protein
VAEPSGFLLSVAARSVGALNPGGHIASHIIIGIGAAKLPFSLRPESQRRVAALAGQGVTLVIPAPS